MMKKFTTSVQLLSVFLLLSAAGGASPSAEELEVILQFFEFDLEDICILKSEAKWNFLTGNKTDLKQLLELELREAKLYKNETQSLQESIGKSFTNKRLQRLFEIFLYPGAPLIGDPELKEYKEYSIKLEELNRKMTIDCPSTEYAEEEGKIVQPQCMPKNYRVVNKILAEEKNEKKLRELWQEWFEELQMQTRKTKFDFMQQLSILDIEAEQNEEDDLADYWLKQADVKDLDYHKITLLWKDILPLYLKLRAYMAKLLEQNYGGNAFVKKNLFPMHLLGSLKLNSWIPVSEKLGAFTNASPYKAIKSKLLEKTFEDLYKMADNLTSKAQIGELPAEFYVKSNFKVKSSNCRSEIFDYCSRKNVLRAISCSDDPINIQEFIQVIENVAKLKHLMFAGREVQDEENGFLFREGPRHSVIYEAVSGLSSLVALRPQNLRNQRLLPEGALPNEEIFSLLLTALHVIPSLPYYLVADLWRINALKEMDATIGESTYEPSSTPYYSSTSTLSPTDESSQEINKREVSMEESEEENNENFAETSTLTSERSTTVTAATHAPKIYDFENLSADWWLYREQIQGLANVDGKLYPDFLQDEKIIWNKPYLSKFLGRILQFQLFEYFRKENITVNINKLQSLMRLGMSKPYHEILFETFEITDISSKPLLNYFKPLEEFLDKGGNFNGRAENSNSENINLLSDSYSMNNPGDEEKTEKGSNTIAFSVLIMIVVAIIALSLFVALRKYRRKQRAKERRKRLNEAIN